MRSFKLIIASIAMLTLFENNKCTSFQPGTSHPLHFYKADNTYFQYTGRIDFSNAEKPRFWSPGVYVKARFKGTSCSIILNDEVLYGSYHNYIEWVVDDQKPVRLKLKNKTNSVLAAQNLKDTIHTISFYKNTESGIGYLEFVGFNCETLLPLPPKPSHKMEFIGNSITCGMSSDQSSIPCGQGDWYDQHNAYLSYGAITARALNAQYHITAVSGIGLIHSCCNMTITMPQVFDKVNLRTDSLQWNFKNYQPDVVTICLGQNDGIQDSVKFCSAYIAFIKKLRGYYPNATIISLTSPMADEALTAALRKYLTSVVAAENKNGDNKVYKYFFTKRYYHGCGGHPDVQEHEEIAKELTAYIKQIMSW